MKYYVTMTDKALSGWGMARGKLNKLVFVCDSYEQAEIVAENAVNRKDQKNINITIRKPYYDKSRYYTQFKTIADYPTWYKKDAFKVTGDPENEGFSIIGRRWFQKSFGNTYHTAEIWFNGELLHKTGMVYGYGEHYLQTATEWLEKNGYLPGLEHYENGSSESLWRYCEKRNTQCNYKAIDVKRERDL